MKTLSQPIEPGRGAGGSAGGDSAKTSLTSSKSTPPRAEPVQAYAKAQFGPTPGPGHNTPQVDHPILVPSTQVCLGSFVSVVVLAANFVLTK